MVVHNKEKYTMHTECRLWKGLLAPPDLCVDPSDGRVAADERDGVLAHLLDGSVGGRRRVECLVDGDLVAAHLR